jgi:pimeloyl-[acyl-carrier protein] methyl ester esterase
MADVDVRDAFSRLALPSLYLRATRDRVIAARFGDEYRALAANGRVAEIDGPHMLLQARPREAAAHILRFLPELTNK